MRAGKQLRSSKCSKFWAGEVAWQSGGQTALVSTSSHPSVTPVLVLKPAVQRSTQRTQRGKLDPEEENEREESNGKPTVRGETDTRREDEAKFEKMEQLKTGEPKEQNSTNQKHCFSSYMHPEGNKNGSEELPSLKKIM